VVSLTRFTPQQEITSLILVVFAIAVLVIALFFLHNILISIGLGVVALGLLIPFIRIMIEQER